MRASLLIVALLGASAHAEDPAEATFKRGRELMKAKRYAEACAAFQQSQQLDPEFGTLFNLATCETKIGKLASAWNAFRQLARSDSNAERRAKAAQEAKELEPRVPHVVATVAKQRAGLVVHLDGNDITSLVGVATPIDFGDHEIDASADGGYAFKQTFTIDAEGTTTNIDVDVHLDVFSTPGHLPNKPDDKPPDKPPDKPADPPKPIVVANRVPVESPPAIEASAPPSRARTGKIIAAVGAGVTVVGGVIGIVALEDFHDAENESIARAADSHHAVILGDVSTAVVVAGLASVAAGVYLWKTAPHVLVAPAPGGGTVGIAGTF